MATMIIKLDSIKKVREFVDIASHYPGKIEVSSGRYNRADGKSILGVLSLELKNNLTLEIEAGKDLTLLMQELEPYAVA